MTSGFGFQKKLEMYKDKNAVTIMSNPHHQRSTASFLSMGLSNHSGALDFESNFGQQKKSSGGDDIVVNKQIQKKVKV